MRIDRILSSTADLTAAAAFYREGLGLTVRRSGGRVRVAVGRSVLELSEQDTAPADHLAFLVPANHFGAAVQWLCDRVPLLSRNGQEEFPGPAGWNSNSVYFAGPDRSVLELIAHADLANEAAEPFDSRQLLAICEVGIAVPDARAAAADLHDRAALVPFGAAPAPDFAAVGDREGRLILAAEGRAWQPTTDVAAVSLPLGVDISGARPGTFRVHGATLHSSAGDRTAGR